MARLENYYFMKLLVGENIIYRKGSVDKIITHSNLLYCILIKYE